MASSKKTSQRTAGSIKGAGNEWRAAYWRISNTLASSATVILNDTEMIIDNAKGKFGFLGVIGDIVSKAYLRLFVVRSGRRLFESTIDMKITDPVVNEVLTITDIDTVNNVYTISNTANLGGGTYPSYIALKEVPGSDDCGLTVYSRYSSNLQYETSFFNIIGKDATASNNAIVQAFDAAGTSIFKLDCNTKTLSTTCNSILKTLTVSDYLHADGSLTVKGNISTDGSIIVAQSLQAYESINCTKNINADIDITAKGNITADLDIIAERNINALVSVISQGTISAVGNISTEGALTVEGDIGGSNDVNIAGNLAVDTELNAKGVLNVTGNTSMGGALTVYGLITAEAAIAATGNISTDAAISAAGGITTNTTMAVGTNLTVSGTGLCIGSFTAEGGITLGKSGSTAWATFWIPTSHIYGSTVGFMDSTNTYRTNVRIISDGGRNKDVRFLFTGAVNEQILKIVNRSDNGFQIVNANPTLIYRNNTFPVNKLFNKNITTDTMIVDWSDFDPDSDNIMAARLNKKEGKIELRRIDLDAWFEQKMREFNRSK